MGFLTYLGLSVEWELSKQRQHNINQKAQAVMKGIKMITVIQQGSIFKGYALYAYSDFESICMAFASRNIFLTLGNLEF